jgi:hypothetical protein
MNPKILEPSVAFHNSAERIESDAIKARMMEICGCNGEFNCECISVRNEAVSELWYEKNSGQESPEKQERIAYRNKLVEDCRRYKQARAEREAKLKANMQEAALALYGEGRQ